MMPLALNCVMQNESARIGGCLAHARTYCDEMVVIDQGSTDNSVEIARMFGARVIEDDDLGCPEASYERMQAETESPYTLLLFADEFLRPDRVNDVLSLSPIVYGGIFGRANYVDGIDITPETPDFTLRYFKKGTVNSTPKLHTGLHLKREYGQDGGPYSFVTPEKWILHYKTLAEQRIDADNYQRLGHPIQLRGLG